MSTTTTTEAKRPAVEQAEGATIDKASIRGALSAIADFYNLSSDASLTLIRSTADAALGAIVAIAEALTVSVTSLADHGTGAIRTALSTAKENGVLSDDQRDRLSKGVADTRHFHNHTVDMFDAYVIRFVNSDQSYALRLTERGDRAERPTVKGYESFLRHVAAKRLTVSSKGVRLTEQGQAFIVAETERRASKVKESAWNLAEVGVCNVADPISDLIAGQGWDDLQAKTRAKREHDLLVGIMQNAQARIDALEAKYDKALNSKATRKVLADRAKNA